VVTMWAIMSTFFIFTTTATFISPI
jgi:hypothetical protein